MDHDVEELSSTNTRYLERILGDVERWATHSRDGLGDVQPGSALASDAALSSKWRVADSASTAWTSAVDNLEAIRLLMRDVVQPFAPYSLLRVAVESAATAVWLIEPEASQERVTRRLRLAWDELYDKDRLLQLIAAGNKSGKTPDDEREEIKLLCQATGLDQSAICGRFSWGDVIASAAPAAGIKEMPWLVEFSWRLCSGFAHGRDWARLSWLESTQVGEVEDGTVQLRMTSGVERMMALLFAAHQLLVAGERLYGRRRLAWRSH